MKEQSQVWNHGVFTATLVFPLDARNKHGALRFLPVSCSAENVQVFNFYSTCNKKKFTLWQGAVTRTKSLDTEEKDDRRRGWAWVPWVTWVTWEGLA